MATEKKTARRTSNGALWFAAARGALLSLAVWLCGAAVLTAVMSAGGVGDEQCYPVLAGLSALAAFAGALSAVRRTPWGSLASSGLVTAFFAALLVGVGLLAFHRITWGGHGGMLLLWTLLGGAAAGILGRPRPKKRARYHFR